MKAKSTKNKIVAVREQGHPPIMKSDSCPHLTVLADRFRALVGRILQKMHIPGFVSDTTCNDLVTGDQIRIINSPLAVCISINNRDYYFDRFTGKFNGTGYSIKTQKCHTTQLSCCRQDQVQE